jgi:hypothetical protein
MKVILAVGIAATACLVLGSSKSRAEDDELSGIRGTLEERAHDVVLTLSRGHATLVVQRTVENLGRRHDQADWSIFVPETAVATALRTRGLVDGRPRWFPGELMEAQAAAAKYHELTGIGGYYPKDPALLSWRAQGHLALQVFPIPPAERKTVAYTLEMPTTYHEGRHELALPVLGLAGERARIVVRAERDGDRLFVAGQPFPSGGRLVWPDDDAVSIALEAPAMPTVAGALGVQAFGPGRVLVHYELDAAQRLARVPRDAQIVVILDWSRSVTEDDARAGLAAAAAYLQHFEGAHVEVLTVDRRVHRRYGRLVPAAAALGDLAGLEPHLANGSAVDAALARADEILASAPAGHARRVLLLSDLMARDALEVAPLTRALRGSGALLHIGQVDAGEPELSARDDDDAWSPVARATGGLLWKASAPVEGQSSRELAGVFEEWARPVRVHRVRVRAPGVELAPDTGKEALGGGTLAEGESIAGLQIARDAPPWIELAGELWARPVRVRVAPDAREARLWSALAFGEPVMSDLTADEMMVLARRGRAVSPVTSYLAIEPGVRPSTEGLEDVVCGAAGYGDLGGSLSSGTDYHAKPDPFAHESWLRRAIRDVRSACGRRRGKVTVAIETTLDEIVDVPRVEGEDREGRSCLIEGSGRWSCRTGSRTSIAPGPLLSATSSSTRWVADLSIPTPRVLPATPRVA